MATLIAAAAASPCTPIIKHATQAACEAQQQGSHISIILC
jgi:hypothetical protein